MIQQINGYFDGPGTSPYSAHADAPTLKVVKKTIKTTDWDTKAAEVPFTEGTFVDYAVEFADKTVASTAVLVLSSIATGKLNFGVTNDPTADLDLFIYYV